MKYKRYIRKVYNEVSYICLYEYLIMIGLWQKSNIYIYINTKNYNEIAIFINTYIFYRAHIYVFIIVHIYLRILIIIHNIIY